MIREFLQCKTINERIDFLSQTVISDWTAKDLDIIIDIMGITSDQNASEAEKVAEIERHLADYHHEVEKKEALHCEKLDQMPSKDEGTTLYEERSPQSLAFNMKDKEE